MSAEDRVHRADFGRRLGPARADPANAASTSTPEDRAEDGQIRAETTAEPLTETRRGRRAQAVEAERAEGKPSRPSRRRRRGWRSPLTRRILTINVIALMIPVLGLLHLDQYRQSLISAELDSLRIKGHAFSLSLGRTAVAASAAGDERLLPDAARSLMSVLLEDSGVRARIFARDGELLADSFYLVVQGGLVQVVELPELDEGHMAEIGRLYDDIISWLPGKHDLPLYNEARLQHASHYQEVAQALAGATPGMVRADRQGRLVLSVAIPVQRYRRVLGALMLSKDGADVDAAVDARRVDILMVCGFALAVTILLSLYLAGTIARPIRRLAEAADMVRFGKDREFEIPDFRRRGDEIGDLSGALRDMTEALRDRLDAIEGFAADVAHEIKNPLTSLRSAVETVARIEDPEQQRRLMSIILDDVQRLDRLISDISDASRLDAELSRARTQRLDLGGLLGALVQVHQATTGESGPLFSYENESLHGLFVQGIESRLAQVFRNLINNAVTFSPVGGRIVLRAWREGEEIIATIADDGPGLPEGKLEAIFDRFYTQRPETEKFGTHSGLGLSISKQIVEAHQGTIRAENRRDAGGQVIGALFIVHLPADL